MNLCKNHPTIIATARCKRCGMPLCDECKLVSEVGVVCSQNCLDAIKAFQARVGDELPRKARRPFFRSGLGRGLIAILVILAVVYGILCLQEGGIVSPEDIPSRLQGLLSLVGL